MKYQLALLWFAVAICPDWWPVPWPIRFNFLPPPPPDPWRWIVGPGPRPPWTVLLSGLAGVVGGLLYSSAWGPDQGVINASYAAVTCIGALAGSILVRGVIDTFLQGRKATAE